MRNVEIRGSHGEMTNKYCVAFSVDNAEIRNDWIELSDVTDMAIELLNIANYRWTDKTDIAKKLIIELPWLIKEIKELTDDND